MSATPPHGSLAEEAARLVAALQDAASGWSAAVVQSLRPQTVQHLTDAAASLAAAVADLVAASREATADPADPADPADAGDPANPANPGDPADPADSAEAADPADPAATPPDTAGQPPPPRDARLEHIDITVRDD